MSYTRVPVQRPPVPTPQLRPVIIASYKPAVVPGTVVRQVLVAASQPVTPQLAPSRIIWQQPPAVAPGTTLFPDFLTHTRAIFSARVNPTLLPGFTQHSRAIFTARVNPTLKPGFTTHSRAIFAARVMPTLKPAFLTHSRAIFSPELDTVIRPAFTTHSRAIFSPRVNPTLLPGFTTHTRATFSPTVTIGGEALLPDFTIHTRAIFSPTVNVTVKPGFTTHTRAIFAARVGPTLKPGFLTHTRAIFAAKVINTLRPAFTVHSRAIFSARVNVVVKVGVRNEIRRVQITADGGSYTLTFLGQTTAPIAFDAAGPDIQGALVNLSNIGPGDVTVTGDTADCLIEFMGQWAGNDFANNQFTANGSGLTGDVSVSVGNFQNGIGTINHSRAIFTPSVFEGGPPVNLARYRPEHPGQHER